MRSGEVVKSIRIKGDMSQKEFAEKIGCKQSYVSEIESGKYMPSIKIAKNIVKVAKSKKVKVSLADLFPDEEGDK